MSITPITTSTCRRSSFSPSTATWRWPAASTRRAQRCSAKASSALGEPAGTRGGPGRFGPRPHGRTTWLSPPIASTRSPCAAAWTRWQLMAVFRGLAHGGWDPRRFGLAPYSIVIGSQALHAVGYALGIQRDAAGLAARFDRRTMKPPRPSRWPTSVTGLPARGRSTRRSSGPVSITRPSSSSARTTSGRSPSQPSGRPAFPSSGARTASASRACGSTATTSWRCWQSREAQYGGRGTAAVRR